MKNTHLTATFALIAVLAGCTHSGTPPRPPGREQQIKQFIQCFREEFKPTDEQLNFLKDTVMKEDGSQRALEKQLHRIRGDLDRGFSTDMPEKELLALFNLMSDTERKLSEGQFRKMMSLRAILNVEQRNHFSTCRKRLGPPQPGPGPEEGA